jgi:hypothetical protein
MVRNQPSSREGPGGEPSLMSALGQTDIQSKKHDVRFTPESGHSHTPGANAVLVRQTKAT